MPLERTKEAIILAFFCFGIIPSFFCFQKCSAAEEGPEAEIEVSVPSNSINRLAQKINQTRDLLIQKREELKGRNEKNLQVALFLLVGGGFLGGGIIFKDLYINYQKKRIRRMKSARRRKKRKN